MIVALWLLAIQGVIGAFDTLYYHEWRARLPARGKQAASELKLHAARDFFYAVLFATLPWLAWQGLWVVVLAGVFVAEIILTLTDFVVEIAVRKQLGDVYAGERVTHAIMGILYGAMIAKLIPTLGAWWTLPTGLVVEWVEIPTVLRVGLFVMAAGVIVSGLRGARASARELALGTRRARRGQEMIARRSFHRAVFTVAGIYNIAWGLWSSADPQWLFRFTGMPLANQPAVFACLGMVVGLYGILYLDVARRPEHGWLIAAVGLLGKTLGPIGMVWLIRSGEWPPSAFVLCLTNDLIWWIPFGLYLYDAWPAFRRQ
jgi:hypothetical protein